MSVKKYNKSGFEMITSAKKILVFIVMAMLMLVAFESRASAEEDFESGKELFKSARYSEALKKFEQARKQGLKTVALYYNLGSTYYRLGDYSNAARNYHIVRQYPEMKALAEYNLGLVSVQMEDPVEAQKWFAAVIAGTDDKKLLRLSRLQLERAQKNAKPWSIFAGIAIGYDDNINVIPEDEFPAGVSDNYLDISAMAEVLLSGRKREGYLAEILYSSIDYSDENNFDQALLRLGIKKTKMINDWQSSLKFNIDQFTYGGEDLQTVYRLEGQARKDLSKSDRLSLRLRYDDVNMDNDRYSYLEGSMQQFRIEMRHADKSAIQRYYYELELNNREDTSTASYSPTRHTFRGIYTKLLDNKWSYSGDLAFRQSVYSRPGSRTDDRWKVTLSTDYRLNKLLKLKLKLTYTDNQSDDPNYNYNRTLISAGLTTSF